MVEYTVKLQKDGVKAKMYTKSGYLFMQIENNPAFQLYAVTGDNCRYAKAIGYHEIDKYLKEQERRSISHVLYADEKKYTTYDSGDR